MAEVLNFEKSEAAPDEPQTAAPDEYGFVRTATAERILMTLNFVRSLPGPQMSMICGVTGVAAPALERALVNGALNRGATTLSGPCFVPCGVPIEAKVAENSASVI